HLPRARVLGPPGAVRGPVLCSRRHGEPHQGAATAPVRRPHQCGDPAGQSDPPVLLLGRLSAAAGAAATGTRRHRPGPRAVQHHPSQAPQDRRPGAGDRAQSVGVAGQRLTLREPLRPRLREPARRTAALLTGAPVSGEPRASSPGSGVPASILVDRQNAIPHPISGRRRAQTPIASLGTTRSPPVALCRRTDPPPRRPILAYGEKSGLEEASVMMRTGYHSSWRRIFAVATLATALSCSW